MMWRISHTYRTIHYSQTGLRVRDHSSRFHPPSMTTHSVPSIGHTSQSLLFPLSVCLGCVVTLVHDQVLRSVVFLSGEVRFQYVLHAGSVALLCVERGTGHVWNCGVATAPVHVLGVAEWVILRCWLREPDITAVAAELAGLERLGNILLDDNGAAGGVDEPRAWSTLDHSQISVYTTSLPFFILPISSLLNKPRVFSCSGQLMVTTSHCASISSRLSTLRQPISFSFSGERGW